MTSCFALSSPLYNSTSRASIGRGEGLNWPHTNQGDLLELKIKRKLSCKITFHQKY